VKTSIFNRAILFLVAGLVYLSSCQKDIEYFIPDPGTGGPDTTWTSVYTDSLPVSQLRSSLVLAQSMDSVQLYSTVNFTTASGIQLSLSPSALITGAGTPVTGNVSIESGLYRKKGELIRMNIGSSSSMGYLQSAGVIHLKLSQNNQPLQLAQGSLISLMFAPQSAPISNLHIYNGVQQTGAPLYWQLNYDTLINRAFLANNSYQVNSNSLGWINAGARIETTAMPSGELTVKLPVNYTNANTSVWLALNNKMMVTQATPNIQDKTFLLGSLPLNEPATIIVMSKQAGQYYFAQQTITTSSANSPQVFITPVLSTLDNIKGYLNSL